MELYHPPKWTINFVTVPKRLKSVDCAAFDCAGQLEIHGFRLYCWPILGVKFTAAKIDKSVFSTCMKDLNAGRTDADHYDAEDIGNSPTDWEIDDITLVSFSAAYAKMEAVFRASNLL